MTCRPDIRVKRAYRAARQSDGRRILVDGLWPRGVARDRLRIDRWARELAPSAGLRRWFGHDPARWGEFRRRYAAELDARPEPVAEICALAAEGPVTLVFGANDDAHNNALALKEYLDRRLGGPTR
jgi:uncharacterized protein YeaO (DUF488 family)